MSYCTVVNTTVQHTVWRNCLCVGWLWYAVLSNSIQRGGVWGVCRDAPCLFPKNRLIQVHSGGKVSPDDPLCSPDCLIETNTSIEARVGLMTQLMAGWGQQCRHGCEWVCPQMLMTLPEMKFLGPKCTTEEAYWMRGKMASQDYGIVYMTTFPFFLSPFWKSSACR